MPRSAPLIRAANLISLTSFNNTSTVLSFYQTEYRRRLANFLAALIAAAIVIFWGIELNHTLEGFKERETALINDYQDKALETKAEELRDAFRELYQSTRTISLLPAIRNVTGGNRQHDTEDVVEQGRLSRETHRTLQQIYTNLQNNFSVSEIYYVLDGFDPARNVPFFMYDDLVARFQNDGRPVDETNEGPPEVEEHEYAYFPKMLSWFNKNAPSFRYAQSLNNIPTLVSPLLITCDNTQYTLEAKEGKTGDGSPNDTLGFIYAMPVYDAASLRFKGMITAVLRSNVIEAMLVGVPFIPITQADHERMQKERWSMPGKPSPFLLTEQAHDLRFFDRRNPIFSQGIETALQNKQGKWKHLDLEFRTKSSWQIHHYLSPDEIAPLTSSLRTERHRALTGRIALLVVLSLLIGAVVWMFRRSRKELLWLAHYDPLTSLPNRHLFFDRMNQGIQRAERSNTKLALFFVDIAGFNVINDTHGQHGGDLVLKEMALRLRSLLRSTDSIGVNRNQTESGLEEADIFPRPPLPGNFLRPTVSRLGGDEFTILCEGIRQADDLTKVAERILESIRTPFQINDNRIEMGLNIGVAVYPDDAKDDDELLMSADSAMQECRQQGGGYRLFNEAMRRKAEKEHQLQLDLQVALAENQFELFYQPKQSLTTGNITSLEALIRWHHPQRGLIPPLDFIPLLERSGRIIEVGEWVLEQSCRDLKLLSEAGYPNVKISANVSVRQLRQGDFHQTVAGVLERTKANPTRLILEITESMVMENLDEGRAILGKLDALGTELAIDDFGTGYSSLTYLQHLPLNYLKLDKSFIDGMTNDRAEHIVASVIRLARGLELHTIAEGIETPDQKMLLTRLGCDIIQGYLLSKPRPLPEILDWMRKQEKSTLTSESLSPASPAASPLS